MRVQLLTLLRSVHMLVFAVAGGGAGAAAGGDSGELLGAVHLSGGQGICLFSASDAHEAARASPLVCMQPTHWRGWRGSLATLLQM